MAIGVLFALAAGLMWGIVFVGPLLLPEYPAALQSFGRYSAFGLIALPLAWIDRRRIAQLSREDWIEALKLSLVGNLLYYLLLASAIRRAGGPLPTMIIGTLPVVITVVSNLIAVRSGSGERPLPWLRLLPSLLLMGAGIALINQLEMKALGQGGNFGEYALGALLAVAAVVCWTWYPIRNARWLRAHADRSPRGWATAQGLATLPLALFGYAGLWAWSAAAGTQDVAMPFGPRPEVFVSLMLVIGLFASWLGTLCWNEASQRLPPALAGQLIVFETLAALSYAFVVRGTMPSLLTLAGAALLVAGVCWGVRAAARPGPATPPASPPRAGPTRRVRR